MGQKQTGGQPSEAAASEAGLEGSEHKVFHIKRDSFFSLRAVQTLQAPEGGGGEAGRP